MSRREACVRHFVVSTGLEADRKGFDRFARYLGQQPDNRRAIGAAAKKRADAGRGDFSFDRLPKQCAKSLAFGFDVEILVRCKRRLPGGTRVQPACVKTTASLPALFAELRER